MTKITPFLWIDGDVEEVVRFYGSIFPNAKVGDLMRHQGRVISANFELEGQAFAALGGRPPNVQFTDAVSFFVRCADQKEVDHYWSKLTDGGKETQCGWLKDRFGVSWQIIPDNLGRYLSDPDRAKAGRVMQAMMKMKKLDVAALDAAYRG
jgi:predicted 3-demethylubiquinone-9 3-methyltransferase (glyoxalase superfamily)